MSDAVLTLQEAITGLRLWETTVEIETIVTATEIIYCVCWWPNEDEQRKAQFATVREATRQAQRIMAARRRHAERIRDR